MTPDPYDLMQRAVNVVNSSAHTTTKVAATLAGRDPVHGAFSLSRTNYWPGLIESRLGRDARVGASSSSVHSEVAVVLHAPHATQGSVLYVTDPFCPNCAKNIVEAGISEVYIDHKGFDKDWAQRREEHFTDMSLAIMRHAGVGVYTLYRKERRIEPLSLPSADYRAPVTNAMSLTPLEGFSISDFPRLVQGLAPGMGCCPFGVAVARDEAGRFFLLGARPHLSAGYSDAQDPGISTRREGKYSYVVGAMNRLLMGAARHGLHILPDAVFCAVVPGSRELVNMAGAGIVCLRVGDSARGKDADSLEAMETLRRSGVMAFEPLTTRGGPSCSGHIAPC